MTKRVTAYAEPAEMGALLREQYTALAEQDCLQGIPDREEFTRRLAGFWGEINHGHAFREGNTRSQTVFFEQLARHAGWSLDVSRLSPHHPASVYTAFVDARFEYQRIRDASGSTAGPKGSGALSAREAALDLANVLYSLIEPDSSPEGQLRRGENVLPETARSTAADPVRLVPEDPDRTTKLSNGPTAGQLKARYAQHPELRNIKLDPYGLADESENEHSAGGSAGTDYQL